MDRKLADLVKQRDLCFSSLSAMADPAEGAIQLLDGVPGVLSTQRLDRRIITVAYRIDYITLRILEDALMAVGFRLEDTFVSRFKHAFYHFTEETQLANMGFQPQSKSTTQIFINSYQQRQHGCRDDRPIYYHHFN